jgi:very-short-patch-repair endonuclease
MARAAEQHGLVTTKQALEDMSLRSLRREIDRGLLIPFRYGVHLVAGVPRTEWQPLMAACLAVGPFVAASHRSAALLHEFPAIARPPDPEITVYGADSRRLDHVVGHRSDFLDPADQCRVRNIPCTSAARTIVDMGRYVTTFLQVRMMDHAKRRRLCGYEDVAECLERIGGRGRPGSGRLRLAVDRRIARGFDPGDTELELTVIAALQRRKVPPFVQQHQVVCGSHVYLIDIAWPNACVGIEVKGDIHLDPSVADNDAERENLLTAAGWRIFEARRTTNLPRLIDQVLGAIQRQQLALFRTRDDEGPSGRWRRR